MSIGWNTGSDDAVQSVFSRTGIVTAQAGDYSAAQVSASGPLGATQVQQGLDTIASVSFANTLVTIDPFTITAGGTWAALLTLPLNPSERGGFEGTITFDGPGDPPASALIKLNANATSSSGGAITAGNTSNITQIGISNLQVRAESGVNVVLIQFRKSGSDMITVARARYRWETS